MPLALTIRNRQAAWAVDRRLLRLIVRTLLTDRLRLKHFDLGICLVGAAEMTGLNERFLHHQGTTDVIAFDYGEPITASAEARKQSRPAKPGHAFTGAATPLHAEIFICVDEAVIQSRRFHTSWQAELVRYVVHGVLHLLGHDDTTPAARRRMKRAENRLLREMARRFPLSKLGQKPKLTPWTREVSLPAGGPIS